jgi:hypothetical protein
VTSYRDAYLKRKKNLELSIIIQNKKKQQLDSTLIDPYGMNREKVKANAEKVLSKISLKSPPKEITKSE